MFSSHPLTPVIQASLSPLSGSVRREVENTFHDYEALLRTATRDREALLGFVDALGVRLDDIPSDPDAARVVAGNTVRRILQRDDVP